MTNRSRCVWISLPLVAACAGGPDLERLDAIRGFEAARDGRTSLELWSSDADPTVRRVACEALGSLADARSAAALIARVQDPEPAVAHAAVFALGALDGSDAAIDACLLAALDGPDANTRLLAARALGARRSVTARTRLLAMVNDEVVPVVRAAAATALAALVSARGGTRALDDAARRSTAIDLAARLDAETQRSVRLALAFALAEAGVVDAAAAARRALQPGCWAEDHPELRWTRVFAVRALVAAEFAEPTELLALAADPDPMVQLAALSGLARRPPAPGAPAAIATLHALVTGAGSAHVRARALELLAKLAEGEDLATALAAATADASPTVRRTALRARAHTAPELALPAIDAALGATDPFDRVAAVRAAAALPSGLAGPRLARAAEDPLAQVRASAIAALAGHAGLEGLDALLARAAADDDAGVAEELGATLLALAGTGASEARAGFARSAFERRSSPAFAEARKALLAAWVAHASAAVDPQPLLLAALADQDLAVRREAARALRALGKTVPEHDLVDRGSFPRVGLEVPNAFLATRPRLAIETRHGRMVVALAPAAAPVHCFSLCQLVQRGALDGLPFHRVVPDFVVQGGDARGDGYGNTSCFGGTLRAEFSPLPFLAGTLGMPRSDEPDSGGGQLFVTLGPAPWLDGRYTALGRIIEGLAVAELIEEGDRIVAARLLGD
ncbi:MAG: peptidylprolyl isomerase [Planctomycetes bacterium]|nr:peptidylprolyl isomerase [Planctomycetota bacterium]